MDNMTMVNMHSHNQKIKNKELLEKQRADLANGVKPKMIKANQSETHEIKESEKGFYHVQTKKTSHDKIKMEYKNIFSVEILSKDEFALRRDGVDWAKGIAETAGYVAILHNPTIKEVVVEKEEDYTDKIKNDTKKTLDLAKSNDSDVGVKNFTKGEVDISGIDNAKEIITTKKRGRKPNVKS